MKRRRVILICLAVVSLVGVGAGVTPSLSRLILHRPDSSAAMAKAISELERTAADNTTPGSSPLPNSDARWAKEHQADIAAEIVSACGWLATRPQQGDIDESGASTTSALAYAYATKSKIPLSEAGRMLVTYAAWEHACWWDRHDRTAKAFPHD